MRILVDPMGSTGFHEQLYGPLREAGCEVRYFRPLKKRPFSLTGRNHRKLVVVDGRVGFTGGFGIAPEWSGGAPSSPRVAGRERRGRGAGRAADAGGVREPLARDGRLVAAGGGVRAGAGRRATPAPPT